MVVQQGILTIFTHQIIFLCYLTLTCPYYQMLNLDKKK